MQPHAYTHISSFLAIYVIQVSHERLAKMDHVFFIANNWDPVVRWWSLLSSDKQAWKNVWKETTHNGWNTPVVSGSRTVLFTGSGDLRGSLWSFCQTFQYPEGMTQVAIHKNRGHSSVLLCMWRNQDHQVLSLINENTYFCGLCLTFDEREPMIGRVPATLELVQNTVVIWLGEVRW